ncbi:DNA replication initiation protein [Musa troglodytarum]|uniref:DNA replication initiation protein n=1 Tax=Musa troglodytarum TaxID=320322 RepID=A0A9E7HCL3_9LILI|nr:DNA replication initiation protein [Musa troglodytarum]
MPEVIMIKKVLLHDETTCCIKPELQVTLQVDAVAKNIKGKSESGYSILRAVFRERLVEFSKTHPQVLKKIPCSCVDRFAGCSEILRNLMLYDWAPFCR